jgi:hypothetical protein
MTMALLCFCCLMVNCPLGSHDDELRRSDEGIRHILCYVQYSDFQLMVRGLMPVRDYFVGELQTTNEVYCVLDM